MEEVSALSGESILGPPVGKSYDLDGYLFQHSLVSLFWGHTVVLVRFVPLTRVSALSGESILGPHNHSDCWQRQRDVSALSGESSLGARLPCCPLQSRSHRFQPSLVS